MKKEGADLEYLIVILLMRIYKKLDHSDPVAISPGVQHVFSMVETAALLLENMNAKTPSEI